MFLPMDIANRNAGLLSATPDRFQWDQTGSFQPSTSGTDSSLPNDISEYDLTLVGPDWSETIARNFISGHSLDPFAPQTAPSGLPLLDPTFLSYPQSNIPCPSYRTPFFSPHQAHPALAVGSNTEAPFPLPFDPPYFATLGGLGTCPPHPLPVDLISVPLIGPQYISPTSLPPLYPKHLSQEGEEYTYSTFPLQSDEATQWEKLTRPTQLQEQYQDLFDFLSSDFASSFVDSQSSDATPSGIATSPTSFNGMKSSLTASPGPSLTPVTAPGEDSVVFPSMALLPSYSYPLDQPASGNLTSARFPDLGSPQAHAESLAPSSGSQSRDTRRSPKSAKGHRECVQTAFGPLSAFPNSALAKLLNLVDGSPFILSHLLEPTIDSKEGQAMLSQITYISDCPSTALQQSNLSIFSLLLDISRRRCLLCGSSKASIDRAVGCVRSHLDHRPFVCGGGLACCTLCRKKTSPARFFTSSLLDDHLNGPLNKFPCQYPGCKATLRRGGQQKHWISMHDDRPFPTEIYSGYGRRKKGQSGSSSAHFHPTLP